MTVSRSLLLRAGGGGAGALAVAGLAAHRSLRRRIAADPESEALRAPATGTPGSAVSADGTELHVESFGNEGAPTVVLIHGWTESVPYWTYVVRELSARGVRSVAYDLRGHGRSGRASGGDYSVTRFGEDVEAVLREFVAPGHPTVVAGHSLGAMSIAAWAEHHDVAARVGAAALMNTGVGELIAESLLLPLPKVARAYSDVLAVKGFVGSRAPLPRFSTPISHALIRYIAFGPAASPAQVAFFERMLIATPPDVRADVGLALSEIDLYQALERLSVPTAVLAGEKDRLTPPSHARRMAEVLPDLHGLTVLDGVGHMAPLERPKEIAELLMDLVGVAAGTGTLAA